MNSDLFEEATVKRIASTAIVAVALFGAAIYYASVGQGAEGAPAEPEPPTVSPDRSTPEPPKTDVHRSGTLQLEAKTSRGYMPEGESESIYTSIDVTAGNFESGERPPLNVAVVLDRSGSMGGRKLRHAKQAAETIVDGLGSRDRLSLITYNAGATVAYPATAMDDGSKHSVKRRIRHIRDSGGTNIGAALDKGFRQLRSSQDEESVNRMILLSDGKPTVGQSDTDRLAERAETILKQGVSVTSMGVGLDYNEDLMTAMANVGGGNYYFIDSPEKVVSMFEEELAGLAETVAKSASLIVEFGEEVELKSVRGYPGDESNGRLRVSLSEFAARQNKSVLLEMAGTFDSEDPEPVVDIELSYEDLHRDEEAHESATLTAVASTDAAKIADSFDQSVVSRVQQVEVAETLEEAMEAYKGGEVERAQQMVQKRKRKLQEAKRDYDLQPEQVGTAEAELDDASGSMRQAKPSSPEGRKTIKGTKEESNVMMLDSKKAK